MAMNNVHDGSLHRIHKEDYRSLRAGSRMNAMMNPGVDKVDFELVSLAVSAVNGCGMRLDVRKAELRKLGVTAQRVQVGLRIAAVVTAAAAAMWAEGALAAG
jgi:alkyl hydroperoxide reductase subunit D